MSSIQYRFWKRLRKKALFPFEKKERKKRFSTTRMQPTVLKLIKVIPFNIWPRKIYSTENLFQLECAQPREFLRNWWKMEGEKMLLLCINIFFLVPLQKWTENFSYELMGKHWRKNRRTNNSCNGVVLYHYKFQGWNIPIFRHFVFRVLFFVSATLAILAVVFHAIIFHISQIFIIIWEIPFSCSACKRRCVYVLVGSRY